MVFSDRIPFHYFCMKGCGLTMARKITMNRTNGETILDVYENYIISKTAAGVSDITVRNYRNNLRSISKHFDINIP